ncbi:MAG: UDP-N-acetylglucosamine 2-epimerase [Acidimicrobiales bacterium]
MGPLLHVFLGTKAQYIKTAPLLRLLEARGVPHRLIDSGQHAKLATSLRTELGVRLPDHVLGGAADVDSVPQAIRWSAGLAARLGSGRRLRLEVFGGAGGICIVHGDTPSTLLATLMARRAGLRVAHLEAGLRSHSLLHPFPEEAIRLLVMRWSALLFAPTPEAAVNLAAMRVKGRVVEVGGNTSLEAVAAATQTGKVEPGPAVVSMHRVENLYSPKVVARFVELLLRLVADQPVRFVVHGPTREVLARKGALDRLESAGVELVRLAPHGDFVRWLQAAPFVITDGGSIQEECALLGVPTLLWRSRSERPDGIGANVVLSRYEPAIVDTFLAELDRLRRPPADLARRPSEHILDVLLEELARR